MKSWIADIDLVQVAFMATFVALTVGLAFGVFVVWANAGSRNLVLTASGLSGAIAFFFLNLLLELRPTTFVDQLSTELTVDRAARSIRRASESSQEDMYVSGASDWLSSNNQVVFATVPSHTLLPDIILFRILAFLPNEPDWQSRMPTYIGKATRMTFTGPNPGLFSKRKCTFISGADLRSRLVQAGNLFAGAPGLMSSDSVICFPPQTTIEMSKNTLTIRNPVCQLSFIVGELVGGHSSASPPGGLPEFETLLVSVRVETTFFALRAQTLDGNKYRDWSGRLMTGVRELLGT